VKCVGLELLPWLGLGLGMEFGLGLGLAWDWGLVACLEIGRGSLIQASCIPSPSTSTRPNSDQILTLNLILT